jgi:hypothetical protein
VEGTETVAATASAVAVGTAMPAWVTRRTAMAV